MRRFLIVLLLALGLVVPSAAQATEGSCVPAAHGSSVDWFAGDAWTTDVTPGTNIQAVQAQLEDYAPYHDPLDSSGVTSWVMLEDQTGSFIQEGWNQAGVLSNHVWFMEAYDAWKPAGQQFTYRQITDPYWNGDENQMQTYLVSQYGTGGTYVMDINGTLVSQFTFSFTDGVMHTPNTAEITGSETHNQGDQYAGGTSTPMYVRNPQVEVVGGWTGFIGTLHDSSHSASSPAAGAQSASWGWNSWDTRCTS